MTDELAKHPHQYPSLESLAPIWSDNLASAGPGTIDLRLERLRSDCARRRELSELLSAVLATAHAMGSPIRAEVLNQRFHLNGVRFRDFDVSRLESAAQAIRKLLAI
jgi:hypothetical protein